MRAEGRFDAGIEHSGYSFEAGNDISLHLLKIRLEPPLHAPRLAHRLLTV